MELNLVYNHPNPGTTLALTDNSSWGIGTNPTLANILSVAITLQYTSTGSAVTVVSETYSGDCTQSDLSWDITETEFTDTTAFTDNDAGNGVFNDGAYYITYTVVTNDVESTSTAGSSNIGTITVTPSGTYSGSTADVDYLLTIDGSALDSAIALANDLKDVLNVHYADYGLGTEEHKALQTVVSTTDATNATTLYTLVNALKASYVTHNTDAIDVGPIYHRAQGTDRALASETDVATIANAVSMVNDIKAKLNLHMTDSTAHTDGDSAACSEDNALTADTFTWAADEGTDTEDVVVTGSAQTLENGVSVTFSATTGSSLDDTWSFKASTVEVLSVGIILYWNAQAGVWKKLSNMTVTYTDSTIAYNETIQNNALCITFLNALERGASIGYSTQALRILDTVNDLVED